MAVTVNPKAGLSIDVPPGATDITVPDVWHLDSNAPTSCQDLTFEEGLVVGYTTI